jgi:hypothetical protein
MVIKGFSGERNFRIYDGYRMFAPHTLGIVDRRRRQGNCPKLSGRAAETAPLVARASSRHHAILLSCLVTGTFLLTDPRQRVAYEHVYHAGAAEQGVHHDHTRRFLANFANDGRFLPSVDVSQGFEGGVRRFGCDYRK